MEMLVITVIAVAAFAAVLVPLFRRGGRGEEREFDMDDVPRAPIDEFDTPIVAPVTAGPVTPMTDVTDHEPTVADTDELELEVQRYRAAVRAGTVCRKCGQANPADSAFCFECGTALARADAQEFE